MKIISSFGEDGYALYGKKFLESYVAHNHLPVTIYYENIKPDFTHELIEYKNLFEIPGCLDLLKIFSSLPVFRGQINGKRNYRYDIFRFCRKILAQCHAAEGYQGKLYWMDADVEFTQELKPELLSSFVQGVFMAYLGRDYWHSCASFIAWDTEHPHSQRFWTTYYQLLVTGQIFTLPEWHDSFVLDAIRQELQLSTRNIAEQFKFGNRPANVFDEVFSGIAIHKKGNLKFSQQNMAEVEQASS